MLKLVPVGLRAMMARKMPPLVHKSIPGVENVQRVFEKVERREQD
jgi:hypothetical protein